MLLFLQAINMIFLVRASFGEEGVFTLTTRILEKITIGSKYLWFCLQACKSIFTGRKSSEMILLSNLKRRILTLRLKMFQKCIICNWLKIWIK